MYNFYPHRMREMDFSELPLQYTLHYMGQTLFMDNKFTFYHGIINQSYTTIDSFSLRDAIYFGTSNPNNGCLLLINGYTTCIMCNNNNYFWFDSHARDFNGMVSADGVAVLLCFANLDSLLVHISELYGLSISIQVSSRQFDVLGIHCHRKRIIPATISGVHPGQQNSTEVTIDKCGLVDTSMQAINCPKKHNCENSCCCKGVNHQLPHKCVAVCKSYKRKQAYKKRCKNGRVRVWRIRPHYFNT